LIGASELDRSRALGIAFISGGGSVLTALVQRYSSAILQAKVDSLEQMVHALRAPPAAGRRERR
jgi:outer membrane murein-binding lipoprotein Lpp